MNETNQDNSPTSVIDKSPEAVAAFDKALAEKAKEQGKPQLSIKQFKAMFRQWKAADPCKEEGKCAPIRFNRLDYLGDDVSFDERLKETRSRLWGSLGPTMIQYVAGLLGGRQVVFLEERNEESGYRPLEFGFDMDGEARFFTKPPEAIKES